MHLIHRTKTKNKKKGDTVIFLQAKAAAAPEAFATYHEQKGDDVKETGFGWKLLSAHEGKERFAGHSWEIFMIPREIDALIAALEEAKNRFATGREFINEVLATAEADAEIEEDEDDE